MLINFHASIVCACHYGRVIHHFQNGFLSKHTMFVIALCGVAQEAPLLFSLLPEESRRKSLTASQAFCRGGLWRLIAGGNNGSFPRLSLVTTQFWLSGIQTKQLIFSDILIFMLFRLLHIRERGWKTLRKHEPWLQ